EHPAAKVVAHPECKAYIIEVAATGVDYISVGALTHTVKAMDISMNIQVEK
ncbi:MAG: hypothetical protein II209_06415, partial [Alistipes sp.]|nr:hypothetical protein [Alistipes sp.]